ncbi:centrosomal protein of 57 kDa-like isoform X3 [Chiloscyllium punctatum]|uniref:centrosomal protein of 57 kDa-like isoform X3 n=1 Tax=Chiloscyllium punctatum TaxID=137246 RepID=UPI003B633DCD
MSISLLVGCCLNCCALPAPLIQYLVSSTCSYCFYLIENDCPLQVLHDKYLEKVHRCPQLSGDPNKKNWVMNNGHWEAAGLVEHFLTRLLRRNLPNSCLRLASSGLSYSLWPYSRCDPRLQAPFGPNWSMLTEMSIHANPVSLQPCLDGSFQLLPTSDSLSEPSFAVYPMDKPFLNADVRQSSNKPVVSYPESNSRAILSALRNLQEKIRKLELERAQAEENLKWMVRGAAESKNILDKSQPKESNAEIGVAQHSQAVAAQLSAAESHCNILEKQLEYMRKMVQNAELGREMALQRQKKISELEEKLREEEHQRKLIQNKAAQLQTGLERNRILLQAVSPIVPKMKRVRSKRKQPVKKPCTNQSHVQPHYRFNLGDIPFVAGKSVSPSHSVRANVQHVLHLLKQHNKILCNDHVVSDQSMARNKISRDSNIIAGSSSGSTTSSRSREVLSELLLTLQDEFGQMSFEHQELVNQIREANSNTVREDLERELESLMKRIEAKRDQIGQVRQHQASLKLQETMRRKHYTSGGSTQKKAHKNLNDVQARVATTRGSDTTIQVRPGTKSKKSLCLLRDMQTLQTTLQKDDVCWSY